MKKPEPPCFRKLLEPLSHRRDLRQVFDGFCKLAACSLAMQTREPEYLEEIKRWQPDEAETFAKALGALITEMQDRPFEDLLGSYYMEFALSHKGQQWNGEFHTPKPVCDMMARMTLGDLEDLPKDRPITVCEPACGSGAMILSLGQACPPEARRRLRVTAIDISRSACDMCFINTTLWGIPARIIHGNTISMELWAAWSNVHYMMPWLPLLIRNCEVAPEWVRAGHDERIFQHQQGSKPQPAEVQAIKAALGQQELELI